jgi:hypothetical protein
MRFTITTFCVYQKTADSGADGTVFRHHLNNALVLPTFTRKKPTARSDLRQKLPFNSSIL